MALGPGVGLTFQVNLWVGLLHQRGEPNVGIVEHNDENSSKYGILPLLFNGSFMFLTLLVSGAAPELNNDALMAVGKKSRLPSNLSNVVGVQVRDEYQHKARIWIYSRLMVELGNYMMMVKSYFIRKEGVDVMVVGGCLVPKGGSQSWLERNEDVICNFR